MYSMIDALSPQSGTSKGGRKYLIDHLQIQSEHYCSILRLPLHFLNPQGETYPPSRPRDSLVQKNAVQTSDIPLRPL
jgi:hypothetical protein